MGSWVVSSLASLFPGPHHIGVLRRSSRWWAISHWVMAKGGTYLSADFNH